MNDNTITIGKLRIAYALTDKDIATMLYILNVANINFISPFQIWNDAYNLIWKDIINLIKSSYKLNIIEVLQEIKNYNFFDIYYNQLILADFLNELIYKLYAHEFIKGLYYVINTTYGNECLMDKDEMQNLCDEIYKLENNLSPFYKSYNKPTSHKEIKEYQYIIFDKSNKFDINEYKFFSKLFIDSIIVNQFEALRYLYNYDYIFQRNIEELSCDKVINILNLTGELKSDFIREHNNYKRYYNRYEAISIKKSLWVGLASEVVVTNLRDQGYDNCVIVYVLVEKLGEYRNKTFDLVENRSIDSHGKNDAITRLLKRFHSKYVWIDSD